MTDMKIERVPPQPQSPVFRLTFRHEDGWVVVAALREYAETHPSASRRERWREWAEALDKELRR